MLLEFKSKYHLKNRQLCILTFAGNGSFKGSLLGISIGTGTKAGTVTEAQKMWRSLQALGAMAFAYSFSLVLIEIQVFDYKNPQTPTAKKHLKVKMY